jgi:hypothetical protein
VLALSGAGTTTEAMSSNVQRGFFAQRLFEQRSSGSPAEQEMARFSGAFDAAVRAVEECGGRRSPSLEPDLGPAATGP